MIAERLRPFYDEQAKKRKGQRNDLKPDMVQKVAPSSETKARSEAGRAAGVNHTYVDQARKVMEASPQVAHSSDFSQRSIASCICFISSSVSSLPVVRDLPLGSRRSGSSARYSSSHRSATDKSNRPLSSAGSPA